MLHYEGKIITQDGLKLYYQSWHPRGKVKAVLGVVHGLGSHSGWFASLSDILNNHGYSVYSFDLRGHGNSPGQRGYINYWHEFRLDLNSFWNFIVSQNPTKSCFLLGHSLGAVIVLDYALVDSSKLSGIITMAPPLGNVGISPFKFTVSKILSWLWPRFTMNTGIPENSGSRDLEFLSAYNTDPLRHTKGTVRLATEFLKITKLIQANLCSLQSPILILQGAEDIVAMPHSSRLFFDKLCVIDKEYQEYPEAYHDLHNDICAQEVAKDIIEWLEKQLDKKYDQIDNGKTARNLRLCGIIN